MKTYIFIFIAVIISLTASAQSVFVVQGADSTSSHLTLAAALEAANDGDYLYLPGGSYSISDLYIKKQINIIGAGHYADSTQATGRTILGGSIIFTQKASNSSLQGIFLSGRIYYHNSSSDSTISNILISRCNIGEYYYGNPSNSNQRTVNTLIKDCVIREHIHGNKSIGHTIENSIISGFIEYIMGDFQFKNCLFTYNGSNWSIYDVSYASFTNCIFSNKFTGGQVWGEGKNSYVNCLFEATHIAEPQYFDNCLENTGFDNLFVNAAKGAFNYDYDYHLNDTTIAKTFGTNGTQCGIYGGENPYKEGATPINPHIIAKMIPNSTNSQGKLNIRIKVQAQNK